MRVSDLIAHRFAPQQAPGAYDMLPDRRAIQRMVAIGGQHGHLPDLTWKLDDLQSLGIDCLCVQAIYGSRLLAGLVKG